MTINLSLTLQTTRIQKQFPQSVFVFIDSLVVSASQDAGGYAISRQENSSCIQVAIPVDELFNISMPLVRMDGLAHGHATRSHYQNRPFPSSPGPLYQNEVTCSAWDMEMIFHSNANETHFHKKGCALGLIGTRKWPISRMRR